VDCNADILSSAALTPAANPTGWAAIIVACAAKPLSDSYTVSYNTSSSLSPNTHTIMPYKRSEAITTEMYKTRIKLKKMWKFLVMVY
jgi:hypothetical protein